VMCNQVSGSTFPLDDTTVTFTAADWNGNTGHASFVITVQDTTAPAITVPNNISVYATGAHGATVTFSFSASDIVDGVVTVISDWASGSTFPLGVTTVHLTATDAHLNVAHASFTVTVTYKWSGFFEPVDNSPKFNVVNAGRAITVKFSLAGNQGLNIFASGYPRYVQIAEGASTSEELIPIEDTVVATTTYLSFNAGTNQYNYVWKTDKTMAGKCYQLQLNLIDGTAHWANFRFTK